MNHGSVPIMNDITVVVIFVRFSYEENDVLVFTKQHNAGEEVIR